MLCCAVLFAASGVDGSVETVWLAWRILCQGPQSTTFRAVLVLCWTAAVQQGRQRDEFRL